MATIQSLRVTRVEQPKEPRYLDLKDDYFKNSIWSNDPVDLELDTYFNPYMPNLGCQFGIEGLRPVIVDLEEGTFLLNSNGNMFYVWNPEEGRLFQIKVEGLDGGKAADMVMNGVDDSLLEQKWNHGYPGIKEKTVGKN